MKGLTTVSRALAGIAALALVAPAMAQDGPAPAPAQPRPDITKPMANVPPATGYQAVTSWPDLTGIWYPDWQALFGSRGAGMQLTPAAQAKLDAWNAKYKDTGPPLYAQAHCLPPGMPGVMQQPYPIEISYQPGRVTLYTEAYEQTRWLYTDGRALPEDPDPFFNGSSVAHWDGSVLVVDTVGFSMQSNLGPGVPHGENMKIRERIYLVTPDMLVDEMTITDPDVLAQPYVMHVAFKRDTEPLREYVCAENNRLTSDDEKGADVDLDLDGNPQNPDDPFGPPPAD
ncbi:MAG TPA: hypothetical protein VL100_03855 [Croceibacterium sp.]|nr:hypothetical protein [Croceibacterium sp.]